jgi:catechol 2,3-dioxygenase-like lactoylglutathione lyase family enzyme
MLVHGLHHVAFLTADIDRLVTFFERVFDARVTFDREENGHRHAFIDVGTGTVLHAFEAPADQVPGRQSIFQRGRLDHLAFNAASEDAFREIRRRLIAESAHATEGALVTEMGHSVWSFSFHDPDDAWHEVMWLGVDARFDDVKAPTDWKMIDLEDDAQLDVEDGSR